MERKWEKFLDVGSGVKTYCNETKKKREEQKGLRALFSWDRRGRRVKDNVERVLCVIRTQCRGVACGFRDGIKMKCKKAPSFLSSVKNPKIYISIS